MAKLTDDTYQSTYSTAINDLVNKAVNRGEFNYDPASDQAYQAYAKQYTRLGNEAAQNTLADVAANTGGLASSYATTAASQARANYNQALTDKIPALMEAAYNRYRGDINDNLAMIGTLQGLDDSNYNRYATDRDYNRNVLVSDRDYNRGVLESDRAYNRGIFESDRAYDYQLGRDKVADEQWQKTYDRGIYESDRAYNYQLDRDKVMDARDQRDFERQVFENDRTFNESVRQFNANYDLALRELEDNESAQEFQKNLQIWQTQGTAEGDVAKYFGVKEGTSTQDAAYQTAQLALSQAQLDEEIRNNKENNRISWYNAQTSRINATRPRASDNPPKTSDQVSTLLKDFTPSKNLQNIREDMFNNLNYSANAEVNSQVWSDFLDRKDLTETEKGWILLSFNKPLTVLD